ncbi:hypothetical protein DPM33_23565 [Mesorhizobium hawassense]|uniref:Uncharacterized protein n=1 Tax=Mesorhizobium hawassense TaxID=1209954 RepID=A0A330HIC4_9HYPH|nr:hypothetical protein [Mesorhizobium hawassense]RAZ88506.1 hypothetical protein DPM33_23565 [Mesorhizobium hawassense]
MKKTNLERHFEEIARRAIQRENRRAERRRREIQGEVELRRRVRVSAYRSPFQEMIDAYREVERTKRPGVFELVLSALGWKSS